MDRDEEVDDDNNIADWTHLYEPVALVDEPMDKAEGNATEDQQPDELGQGLVDA